MTIRLPAITLPLVLALLPAGAWAQVSKSLTGETQTASATVEAIERVTRQVTLKNEDGRYEVLYVPTDVKRFDTLKVGDTVKIRYYENVVLVPHVAGQKPVDTSAASLTTSTSVKPGGTAARQRTITATITAIDSAAPSITFTGPNGWAYSSRVEDKKALAKVKVGDQFDITWTTALLVAVEDLK
jgi:hypothetical protein